MSTKSTVFHGLKWLSIAKLIAQITRWGVTLLVITKLNPEDYGIAVLAQSVLGLLELFTSFGLGAAIVQAKKIDRHQLRVIFGMILLVNLGLATILWIISPLAASFYDRPELITVLRVLSLSFIFVLMSTISSNMLVRDMEFRTIALSQIVASFCGAGVSLYMAYNGYGYWTLIFGGLTIFFVDSLIKLIAKPIFLLPIFSISQARGHLTFGGLVMSSIIVRYLYVNLDVIIAGKSWTAETLGLYAVALQIAVLPLNKLMPMIRQVAFPAYSRNQGDLEKVRKYMTKSMELAMALCFPLFFGISSIAILFVPVLLGERWASIAMPVTILCLIIPFRMLIELYEPALNATGKPRIVFTTSLLILAVMVPTFIISIPFGVIGLCIGWLVTFPLIALLSSYRYCQSMNLSFRKMVSAIRAPLLGSTIMFLIVRLFISALSTRIAPPLALILSILVGMCVYAATIFILDRSLVGKYRNVLFSKRESKI